MLEPAKIIEKAKKSSFYRKLLNWSLDRMIPFNKPHGFRVVQVDDFYVKAKIPYVKSNFNHIGGLHACALATLSEFTTGFLLVARLDARKYRLIMQRLEMDYYFQGKMDAFAEFEISKEWLQNKIYEPLTAEQAIVVNCVVKITDVHGNHLTTGNVYWQIKDWRKVKTKT